MLAETFAWWLIVEAVGLIALPIALVLFRRLPGSGIAYAKPLGLLLGGYLFWLALTAHVLPNRPGSIVWVFLGLAAVDFWLLRRRWRETLALLESKAGLILAVEIVFMVAFFVGSHIKSYIPEIVATEKPMDFMFLNTADRSRYYPPEDPWLAGFDVSYYYFGYLIQAMLGNLAAVKTSVAFNLGLASTAALGATAAFGLGHDLASMLRRVPVRAAVGAGVAAAIFVALLGNLEGAVEFGRANGVVPDSVVRQLDVANLDTTKESDSCLVPVVCIKYPDEKTSFWWWWRATRISPDANSITEFPFFSFILGDLHPHVMSIPYVLMVVALGLSLWRSEAPLKSWRDRPLMLLLSAVLLGGLGFLNTWDLPTFGFLLAMLVLLRNLAGRPTRMPVLDTLTFVTPLAALAVLLYAPFYMTFGSQASGFAAVGDEATKPLHSVLFWAPLIAVCLPLPLARLAAAPGALKGTRVLAAVALPLVVLIFWALVLASGGDSVSDAVSERGVNWLTTVFFGGALSVCLLALWGSLSSADDDTDAMTPVLGMMSLALLLVYGAELFYVKDVFENRLNSVFKLYYQAWLLLGVAGGFSCMWLLARWLPSAPSLRLPKQALVGGIAVVLAAALLYPIGATLSRTEGLSRGGRTLDGTQYLRAENVNEYLALDWLRQRAQPGERLIEANTEPDRASYSPRSLVSAFTGVPTVLGWPGHEQQWARDAGVLVPRREDVDKVYTTDSLEEAVAILRKYGVTYVYVGSGYAEAYPAAAITKFDSLQAVFHSGDVIIYRVPPASPRAGQ
jgi:YYY domain-containing protein